MANKKFKKIGKISETENSGFGNYYEDNGGGSPKGGKYGGRSGRYGWSNRVDDGEVREGEKREKQPRTDDGKFTYNSVNGKELKYESRGETVNPLLTNGENGIYIEDVENRSDKAKQRKNANPEGVKGQFQRKSGAYYGRFKGNFFQKKSMKATKDGKKYSIRLSNDDIWEIGRRSWDISKGEFTSESANWDEVKKGAPGKAGKTAKALAKKKGEEQYVRDETGGIKVMGDTTEQDKAKALKKLSKSSQLKHSPAQIQAIRDALAQSGEDTSAYTDEQIDQLVDTYLSLGA